MSASLRPAVRTLRPQLILRQPLLAQTARRYASETPKPSDESRDAEPNPQMSSSKTPLFVGLGGLFALVSGYYFLHTPRSPNEGHSAIQEKRKEQGTQNEYRDPRDSGVKTLEQKKARDGQ